MVKPSMSAFTDNGAGTRSWGRAICRINSRTGRGNPPEESMASRGVTPREGLPAHARLGAQFEWAIPSGYARSPESTDLLQRGVATAGAGSRAGDLCRRRATAVHVFNRRSACAWQRVAGWAPGLSRGVGACSRVETPGGAPVNTRFWAKSVGVGSCSQAGSQGIGACSRLRTAGWASVPHEVVQAEGCRASHAGREGEGSCLAGRRRAGPDLGWEATKREPRFGEKGRKVDGWSWAEGRRGFSSQAWVGAGVTVPEGVVGMGAALGCRRSG